MLSHNPFYHKTIRGATVAFGSLFNDIDIVRVSPDGSKTQTVRVPLSYASADKAFERRNVDPTLNFNMQGIFPRASFYLVGLDYDPTRRLTPFQNQSQNNRFVFSPTPYILSFDLYLATANLEDGFQIIEQIIPFFNPEYTISTNMFPTLGLKQDVPVTLNSITYSDPSLDSEFSDFRIIEWTLSFSMNVSFAGPIGTRNQIKHTKIELFDDLPFNDSSKNVIMTADVVPETANKDDPHEIIEDIQDV